MKNELIKLGYELKKETNDYKLFVNTDIRFIVILFDFLNYDSECINDVINEQENYIFHKKSIGFIKETDLIDDKREEFFRDEYWFLKVDGYDTNMIPRKLNTKLNLIPVSCHQEPSSLFLNPYDYVTNNIKNLLSYLNITEAELLDYKYPKPNDREIVYIRYMLSDILEINKIE